MPFEHKILQFINSERYLLGNDKNANLVDLEGKDIGKCNLINFSELTQYTVESNYFDVDYAVEQIMNQVGADHVGRAKDGMKLENFKDLLSGYKYTDSEKDHLEEEIDGVEVSYLFARNLSCDTYEYVFGYRYTNGKEYDYENPVIAGIISYSVKKYDSESEVKLVKALEDKLSSIGFNTCEDGVYKNESRHSVSVSYDNGTVVFAYAFHDLPDMKLENKSRTNETVEPDNYNYLGLEKIE